MTVIICLVLLVLLGYAFFKLVSGATSAVKMHVEATKIFIKQPGADAAYELIKRNAVNGRVSDEVFDEAVRIMASKGASSEDIFTFLFDCNMLVEMDAQKTRARIYQAQEKLRRLDRVENYATAKLDPVDAAVVGFEINEKRRELETEIDMNKDHLNNR